ncbi:MAG TPA: VOC family protein [Longimicrobium sp.]|nr:VOC family protein [Longimicrobium sp.]
MMYRLLTLGPPTIAMECMMKINPYLMFNGQCAEAFRFYADVLGGTIVTMMTHRDSPMADQTPPDWQDAVMHASLSLDGGQMLMASDEPPGETARTTGGGYYVSLHIDEPAEAERVFGALAEGGTVRLPIQQTFWATRFGMLVDRFGTPWMINCAPES